VSFECCTYRTGRVNAETPVRTDRRDNAPVAFRVRAASKWMASPASWSPRSWGGQRSEPIVVDSEQLELRPGEAVHVVNYIGEGVWKDLGARRLYHLEIAGKEEACGGPALEPGPCAAQIVENRRQCGGRRCEIALGKKDGRGSWIVR